ncbi:MAG: hypothetical protein ACJ72Y_06335, partial [Actinomycetes bacterium]
IATAAVAEVATNARAPIAKTSPRAMVRPDVLPASAAGDGRAAAVTLQSQTQPRPHPQLTDGYGSWI